MLQQRTINVAQPSFIKLTFSGKDISIGRTKHFCGILIKATVCKVLDPLNLRVSCTVCCRESLIRVLESEMKIVHEIWGSNVGESIDCGFYDED